MYPRNAASPERIAVGTVVNIYSGAVQSSGVSITVRGQGGAEGAGAGTTVYGASGVVYYTPTQGETDFASFVVIASKTDCWPVAVTVVTTASATPGYAGLDWSKVTAPTTAVDLSNTTIKTTQKVDVETIKTNPVVNGGTITFPTNATVASSANVSSVETDTQDIQSRLPAALTGDGNIKADTLRVNGTAQTAGDLAGLLATATAYIDTEITSILSRIGSFTGSGVNTILGFFQALMRKDSTTPSDLGGNYDDATDSLEAIRDNMGTAQTGDTFALANGASGFVALKTVVDAILADTGTDGVVLSSATYNAMADAILARSLGTEAVSADGAVPTVAQAFFEMLSLLGEFTISGTTITCKKRDGSTTLFTSTLDSSSAPTSRTRAT